MELLLIKLKSHSSEKILNLTGNKDYLADKLEYLDKLNNDDNLRSILINTTKIIYSYNSAKTLEWLKYFPNITELTCTHNNLTSSSLKSLSYALKLDLLSISYNFIDDISDLKIYTPNLTRLFCYHNMITTPMNVDLMFPKLIKLSCAYNKIEYVDISNCISLKFVDCVKNDIAILIIQNASNLRSLYCMENAITNLEVSKCEMLEVLNCGRNKLIELNIKECFRLEHLNCEHNQLTKLDLKGLVCLDYLSCRMNQLTDLISLTDTSELSQLLCNNNQLTTLDLSKCLRLMQLKCFNNKIPNIKKICKHLKLSQFEYDACFSIRQYQGPDTCYICLDTETILLNKIVTECGHIFHEKCLMTWLNRYNVKSISTCPYCRQLI